jgi:hypothetical protein
MAGTLPMMTQPPNAASIKMYSATKPVIAIEKYTMIS